MTVEFVEVGRCPTCQQPRWRAAVCTCTHAVTTHSLGKRAGMTVRTYCTHHDCGCSAFVEVTP